MLFKYCITTVLQRQFNPPRQITNTDCPAYTFDVNHGAKIDCAAVVHVRMTCHGNDVKYFYQNTVCDAANRIDQDTCSPMTFVLDELTDTSDQYHPRPMTSTTELFNDEEGNDEKFVTILGQKYSLKSLKNEVKTLTSLSLRHCKNDQKGIMEHTERLYKKGMLEAWWTGKPITYGDDESFKQQQRFELERLKAPVLMAAMIDMVQRLAHMKIRVIFHITGVPEASRFFKQRLNHLNTITSFIRDHPHYRDLFKGANSIYELLGDNQLWFTVAAPVGNGFTRPNGLPYTGRPNQRREAAFEAFVKNQVNHTFHAHMIAYRKDKYNPISEYMLPIYSGSDVFSQIADTANASMVTNDTGDPAYNANLDKLPENTPCGHRRNLFFANNKLHKQLHIRHIIKAQSEREFRDVAWVKDERFTRDYREVPIVAARGARPVVVKNYKFRTTAHSGNFKQKVLESPSIDDILKQKCLK